MLAVLAFGTVETWSLAIFQLNALVMLVLVGWWQWRAVDFEWWRVRASLPLWLLFGWGLVQLVSLAGGTPVTGNPEVLPIEQLGLPTISKDPAATREALLKVLALAICQTVALLVINSAGRRRLVARMLTGFGLVVAAFAILQRLSWNGRIYWWRTVSIYVAPFGPYGNYNHFAGMVELLYPLPLATLVLARLRTGERIFNGLAVVLLIAAGILSMSRGGMVALAVQSLFLGGVILWRWRRGERPRELRMTLVIAASLLAVSLVVGVAVGLVVGYDGVLARLGSVQQGTSEYSVVTRLAYWKASWRMFVDHPLTGVGLGAFPAIYPMYGGASSRYERVEQVHNDYLQLLTETGIVGGVILLLFVWQFGRTWVSWGRMEGRRSEDRALLVGSWMAVLGLAVHSLFDFNLQLAANALLFLVVAALSMADGRRVERRRD